MSPMKIQLIAVRTYSRAVERYSRLQLGIFYFCSRYAKLFTSAYFIGLSIWEKFSLHQVSSLHPSLKLQR